MKNIDMKKQEQRRCKLMNLVSRAHKDVFELEKYGDSKRLRNAQARLTKWEKVLHEFDLFMLDYL